MYYYYSPNKGWFINGNFTPTDNRCFAYLDVAGVVIPMGEQTCECVGTDGEWQKRTITTSMPFWKVPRTFALNSPRAA